MFKPCISRYPHSRILSVLPQPHYSVPFRTGKVAGGMERRTIGKQALVSERNSTKSFDDGERERERASEGNVQKTCETTTATQYVRRRRERRQTRRSRRKKTKRNEMTTTKNPMCSRTIDSFHIFPSRYAEKVATMRLPK